MKRIYLLPALAILGLAIAVVAIVDGNRSPPASAPLLASAQAPFKSYVAGVGITETGRGNVAVGTALSGIVAQVDVRVGDQVQVGAPLFKIDDRDLQARLTVARAKIDEATAALAKPSHRLQFLDRLRQRDNGAISAQVVSESRDDVRAATANLEAAKAEAAQIAVDIDRSLVRAPAAGKILQVNLRAGEFVEGGGIGKPLLLVGDDSRIYLRVDVDENDAWRVRPDAPARAFVRGDPHLQVPLRFEYIEPYVTPKTSLTGQSTERTDVRVLQVVYSFERGKLPVYLGQQMDVFIAAARVETGTGAESR